MVLEPDVNGKYYLVNMVLVQSVADDFNSGFRLDIFKKLWIRLLKEYDKRVSNGHGNHLIAYP